MGKKRKASEKSSGHEQTKRPNTNTGPVRTWRETLENCGNDIMKYLVDSSMADFLVRNWEKKPLVISRNNLNYYKDLFSSAKIDEAMKAISNLDAPTHVNLCKCIDGHKVSMNPDIPDGELLKAEKVWKIVKKDGATLQFHQPQNHCDAVRDVTRMLEEAFGGLVGVNSYLTPPGETGLAPHFDDVEVFVLQIEGTKKWRLHELPKEDRLPRDPSPDLDPAVLGKPTHEFTLSPGDLLYMPRGTVHQASSQKDTSLHLTISLYQRTSWYDFLQRALQRALTVAFNTNVDFRKGLPVGWTNYMGTGAAIISNIEKEKKKGKVQDCRESKVGSFYKIGQNLLQEAMCAIDMGITADEMAADFMYHRLPPADPPTPEQCSAGLQAALVAAGTPDAFVRLKYRSHLRMEISEDEEGEPRVFMIMSVRNKAESHMLDDDVGSSEGSDDSSTSESGSECSDDGKPTTGRIGFPKDYAPALAILMTQDRVRVGDIPGGSTVRTAVLTCLADEGVLEVLE